MVPLIGVQPYAVGVRSPFALQRRREQPRSEAAPLRLRHESEVLQFDLRKGAAVEFAESESLSAHVAQNIEMQRLACEQGIDCCRGHLDALVPAQRGPHETIERDVLAARQSLES